MAKSFLLGLTKIVFEELRKNQREKEKQARNARYSSRRHYSSHRKPAAHKSSMVECSVKQYEKPSQLGINQGRISKLTIKRNGKIVANYDRAWDIIPMDAETNKIYRDLYNEYN